MKRLRHPIRAIREPFGTAGLIIAMIALVAALGGGAYAAKGGLTGKQKKEVAKIAQKEAKKFAAKNGTNGTNGLPGTKGDKGDAGGAGATGPAGPQGPAGPAGPQGKQGVQGVQGIPGETGFTETLPPGETETGTFAYRGSIAESEASAINVPISFPIPLASPLGQGSVHMISADGSKEIVIRETSEGPGKEEGEGEEVTPTACGIALTPAATAANPAAAPGNLCVYVTKSKPKMKPAEAGKPGHSGSNFIVDPSATCELFACWAGFGGPGDGAGVSGARMQIAHEGGPEVYGWGTWAVTAPTTP